MFQVYPSIQPLISKEISPGGQTGALATVATPASSAVVGRVTSTTSVEIDQVGELHDLLLQDNLPEVATEVAP